MALHLFIRLSYAGDLPLGEGVKGEGIESGGGKKLRFTSKLTQVCPSSDFNVNDASYPKLAIGD